MNRIEQQLADALTARVDAIDTSSIRPLPDVQPAGEPRPGSGRRWLAPVAAAASIVLVATAAAVAARLGPGARPDQPAAQKGTFHGVLHSVDALSAADAWAVGDVKADHATTGYEPLIMHWDGTSWRRTAAPASPGGGTLTSIAGSSPDNVWAVGSWEPTGQLRPLIVHWNGKRWRPVHFAGDAKFGYISGLAVRSATDAWAVGFGGTTLNMMILHWNGQSWRQLPIPRSRLSLTAVTAISANDAWAIGDGNDNLILHWNGSTWKRVRGPDPRDPNLNMTGLASGPTGVAWAVGADAGHEPTGFVIRWDGSAWRQMRDEHLPKNQVFVAIADSSPNDLWAAGSGNSPNGSSYVMIRHWNGTNWSRPAGLERHIPGSIFGLSADSASDAWAVGSVEGLYSPPLILHWNGSAWKKVFS